MTHAFLSIFKTDCIDLFSGQYYGKFILDLLIFVDATSIHFQAITNHSETFLYKLIRDLRHKTAISTCGGYVIKIVWLFGQERGIKCKLYD